MSDYNGGIRLASLISNEELSLFSTICPICKRDVNNIRNMNITMGCSKVIKYYLKLDECINTQNVDLKNRTLFVFCNEDHLCEFIVKYNIKIDQIVEAYEEIWYNCSYADHCEEMSIDYIDMILTTYLKNKEKKEMKDEQPKETEPKKKYEDVNKTEVAEPVKEENESKPVEIYRLPHRCEYCGNIAFDFNKFCGDITWILCFKEEYVSEIGHDTLVFCCEDHLFSYIDEYGVKKEWIHKVYYARNDFHDKSVVFHSMELDYFWEKIEEGRKKDKNMIIFISGPMTNNPDYEEDFKKAENYLKGLGYSVLNPAEINKTMDDVVDREKMLSHDLHILSLADGVYMLDGWEGAKGCNREYGYAVGLGLPIMFENEHYIVHDKIKRSFKTEKI